uniref:Uncharacterized protein n=1 Tax=Nothoprocta perdicaria TaxID=30464 RepID=A0A8C6YUW2_NOTPE
MPVAIWGVAVLRQIWPFWGPVSLHSREQLTHPASAPPLRASWSTGKSSKGIFILLSVSISVLIGHGFTCPNAMMFFTGKRSFMVAGFC